MESEKLLRIMRANAPHAETELAAMSDADGWRWVYENSPPRKAPTDTVCFTGYSAAECEELHALAARATWLTITSTVTKKLTYLCAGTNAGPAKVAKAQAQGVPIIDRAEFEALIAHGEVPG